MSEKGKQKQKDYSSAGDIMIQYRVSDPDQIKKCHSTFEQFCKSVEMVGHTHSPQVVQLSLDDKGRVKIEWLAGGPLALTGYSSNPPIFDHWHPPFFKQDGTLDRFGELSGKLPSGATFAIPLAR